MRCLVLLGAILIAAVPIAAQEGKSLFEDPVRLTVEGRPLNQEEKLLYPTPVLLDIDADGQNELVVGDLWGQLWIHEKGKNRDQLAWEPAKKLQANGKDLKVPNW
jgi:hypothetical protein